MPGRLVRAVLVVATAVLAGVLGRALLSDAGAVIVEATDTTATGAPTGRAGPSRSSGVIATPAQSTGTSDVVGAPGAPTATASGQDGAGPLVVHVVGKVHRPGLVTLTAGARVADAVTAAGGATRAAALSRINLARRPGDGEQILVPGPDDPIPPVAAAPGAAPGQDGTAGGPLNLNTASQSDLEELPGIGPVTAERIVAWRQAHQRFTRVDELGEVSGIGPKTLAQLRPLVTV